MMAIIGMFFLNNLTGVVKGDWTERVRPLVGNYEVAIHQPMENADECFLLDSEASFANCFRTRKCTTPTHMGPRVYELPEFEYPMPCFVNVTFTLAAGAAA